MNKRQGQIQDDRHDYESMRKANAEAQKSPNLDKSMKRIYARRYAETRQKFRSDLAKTSKRRSSR